MDTEAVLLSISEKERWIQRMLSLEMDLAKVRKRIRMAEKHRRKLLHEASRLGKVAAAMANPGIARDNERTTPFSAFR